MQYEGVVDVFQTVRTLRTQRPAMVQTEDQYQFCYRAALEYLSSFDHFVDWQSAGLELGVWRNFVILRVFGHNPSPGPRTLPLANITMTFSPLQYTYSRQQISLWSSLHKLSPIKSARQSLENGFQLTNGRHSRRLSVLSWLHTCLGSISGPKTRVYGGADFRFRGASAPPTSDSPPYLPISNYSNTKLSSHFPNQRQIVGDLPV